MLDKKMLVTIQFNFVEDACLSCVLHSTISYGLALYRRLSSTLPAQGAGSMRKKQRKFILKDKSFKA
ncbi:hypothetical protein L1987_62848 [Smallanthus sonchifolius]|uniref:Uncharacterized protein n=1 Tax=Smallanthus sonchifolius TaxID=185202 RepID=A0ACB9CBJ4_9ASTR|nr:hypothetical protein L1987_62848 [Smallanthus sonchifolius]